LIREPLGTTSLEFLFTTLPPHVSKVPLQRGSLQYPSKWGSRRYQGKIFGKEDSDEITIGRQVRLHTKKQPLILHATSHTERDIPVLDSQTGSVIPVYGPL
jgi:hypothetical protein